jgi:cyclic pyranopterin phosphate synthase
MKKPPRKKPAAGIGRGNQLTHLNAKGEARMVDVGDKAVTAREAVAEGTIAMKAATLKLIVEGGHRKGDVLATARLAGIQAAKKTAELIPLCHALTLSSVQVDVVPEKKHQRVRVTARAKTTAQTGVEMEALTAVAVALLTVYDMCKAVDRAMTMSDIRLLAKSGGRSGRWRRGLP